MCEPALCDPAWGGNRSLGLRLTVAVPWLKGNVLAPGQGASKWSLLSPQPFQAQPVPIYSSLAKSTQILTWCKCCVNIKPWEFNSFPRARGITVTPASLISSSLLVGFSAAYFCNNSSSSFLSSIIHHLRENSAAPEGHKVPELEEAFPKR